MSDNPQFIRTDNAIIHALITLLKRKPFEKITVQDILDETPVTRATFYAHFRDKYDIAERIMESFFSSRRTAKQALHSPTPPPLNTLKESFPIKGEQIQILLNVHTEKVDFRRSMAHELEEEYLSVSTSPTRELESRIYAQIGVEVYLALLKGELTEIPQELFHNMLISVMLRILQIPADDEAYAYLQHRVAQVRQLQ